MPLRHARKIAPSRSQCTHSAQEGPIAHGSRKACIENPGPFQACCQILPPHIIFTSIPSLLAGRTSLFRLPISIELLEKCDKIIGLLLVLQTSVDHLRYSWPSSGRRSVERRRTFAATCSRNLPITSLVVAPHTSRMLVSNTATIFSFTRR